MVCSPKEYFARVSLWNMLRGWTKAVRRKTNLVVSLKPDSRGLIIFVISDEHVVFPVLQ